MVEITHLVAILLALGATLSNSASSLFIRVGTDRGRAYDAVLAAMTVNVVILTPLVAVVYYPDYGLTRQSVVSFVAAGMLGTLLGRLFNYTSIDRIGASRTVPIIASWALISSVLGIVILGETVTLVHWVAIVLIVGGAAGVAWETTQENPDDLSRRQLLLGVVIPFVAALAYGWEPIFANFGFAEGTPAPVGLVIKTMAATLGFLLYLRWRRGLPPLAAFREADMRWFLLAGVANTLFLLGYYLALELAPVSIVTPILATNALFVVLLSAVFMPRRLERVTWRLVTAATVVVVGVVLLTAHG